MLLCHIRPSKYTHPVDRYKLKIAYICYHILYVNRLLGIFVQILCIAGLDVHILKEEDWAINK